MRKIKGFGLIEVLVALVIMAVGLLAVASFQSGLIGESSENRTRAEAIALAQERIEQLRNYTDSGLTQDDFDTLFTVGTDKNKSTINGSLVAFTRAETIVDDADFKDIVVTVSWDEGLNGTQSVNLNTQLAWLSPSLPGELDSTLATGPYVRSATGRAKLGAGQVTDDEFDTEGTIKYTNGDGTGLLDRGDGDLRLTSGKDVVLTLEDACEIESNVRTNNPCTGFVKISGRVYVDVDNASFDINNIYVIASDAAFCQRYIVVDEVITPITTDIANGYFTPNDAFEYYDYTCYLGGGWHGNVGLLKGVSNDNKTALFDACMGDPYSTDSQYEIKVGVRRVYRGMAFIAQNNGNPTEDATGFPIYYSVGVNDALILPQGDDAGHDFFVTSISNADEQDCITNMKVPDADIDGVTGARFANMPNDFVCLNQNGDYLDESKLDAFGYTYENFCPYDPSDPPSKKYAVTGSINLGDDTLTVEEISSGIDISTSESLEPCTVSYDSLTGTTHTLLYSCNVYDWGEGWQGTVNLASTLDGIECETNQFSFLGDNAITADKQINTPFSCKIGDVDPVDPVDPVEPTIETIVISGDVLGKTSKFSSVSISLDNGDAATFLCDKTWKCSANISSAKIPWSGSVTFSSAFKGMCVGDPAEIATGYSNSGEGPGVNTISVNFSDISALAITLDIAVLSNGEDCNDFGL